MRSLIFLIVGLAISLNISAQTSGGQIRRKPTVTVRHSQNKKNNVTNLSDYYIKSMTGDKTVNHLFVDGNYVYLSTGFGIIKLNVKNGEFSDTYNLGFNVDYSYIENNTIFAASKEKGLYAASLSSNLLDKSNWKRTGNYTRINKTVDPELLRKAANANPGGPKHNHFAYMTFRNGQLYTCGGGFGNSPSISPRRMNTARETAGSMRL